ncbi:hypothetical protein AQUCO_02700079v1 [Aquilegia coerulea]|uniref:Cell number regulator 8 n=1 Tax=Aquilegia coerulea TaxID=218851 RepID=A0A2G5D532_AQUCA|nr:hypothetical protein AQUCO_02700079v1 [Aquilegia coerulea]
MANSEESSPLLNNKQGDENEKVEKTTTAPSLLPPSPTKKSTTTTVEKSKFNEKCGGEEGWTVDGLPLGHGGSVVGEPVGRSEWNSSLFACLGRNDDFCSSDLEVCNAERLGSGAGSFANHCLPYTGLYLLGNSLFGWNCMAPLFSHHTRSAIRRKFNLEGSFEAFTRSCGCCGGMIEDEVQREQCESACDVLTHFFCHTCSLCQEGRELRRRLPHPGFNGRVLVMIPPGEQSMNRSRG